MIASRYDTPARHCEAGSLWVDSLGNVLCTVHGDQDVPSLDEVRANVADGFEVVEHSGNHLLYVVEKDRAVFPSSRVSVITAAARDAFWSAVAAECPEITSGDIDPLASRNFDDVTLRAVQTWIVANGGGAL